jgi:hypothetical protein
MRGKAELSGLKANSRAGCSIFKASQVAADPQGYGSLYDGAGRKTSPIGFEMERRLTARRFAGSLAWALILASGISAGGQTVGRRAPESAPSDAGSQPESRAGDGQAATPAESDSEPAAVPRSLLDRLHATLSQQADADNPINTDRPTFTPANTVVPRGRLQFESGFTFNSEQSATTRTQLYDAPELAVRYGIWNRVELRTFWLGEDDGESEPRRTGRSRHLVGANDMEAGFKWQLLTGDKERKWIPTTALITSVIAPTGGTSAFGSHTVEPYINLIYGWSPTDKLTLAGSTGYLGMRQTDRGAGEPAVNFQRYHQSIVAFYSATDRTTLFYEWYILMFTNAPDNRPTHFMDGGVLYRLTPNIQLDLRAGFGLSGRPDDFFTGVGLSARF